jgi:hypothetical protein
MTSLLAHVFDYHWFTTHRDRSHRVRAALAGEDDRRSRVIVRQIEPGVYQHVSFDFPVEIPDVEEIVHAIFDVISNAVSEGRTDMPSAELGRRVHARVCALAAGGNA